MWCKLCYGILAGIDATPYFSGVGHFTTVSTSHRHSDKTKCVINNIAAPNMSFLLTETAFDVIWQDPGRDTSDESEWTAVFPGLPSANPHWGSCSGGFERWGGQDGIFQE